MHRYFAFFLTALEVKYDIFHLGKYLMFVDRYIKHSLFRLFLKRQQLYISINKKFIMDIIVMIPTCH